MNPSTKSTLVSRQNGWVSIFLDCLVDGWEQLSTNLCSAYTGMANGSLASQELAINLADSVKPQGQRGAV